MGQRVTVYYSGMVQGVGFRYTTVRLSRRFDVAGWVRNLDDGRVEVVAEGEPAAVESFLQAIRDSELGEYVHDAREQWSAETGVRGFRIEH